jgi:methyl-accepting chemotaxis protein
MLSGILEEYPELLGAWCCWEPDVLEGNDRAHIGTPGAAEDGRFVPYWSRPDGKVVLDLLVDYDKPGPGDYYLLARNSGHTTILDPYDYEIGGKTVLITSIAAPIIGPGGRVLGVAGVDIGVDKIQEITQGLKPYPDTLTAVFSNNGTVTSHFDPGRIGKYMETEREMAGPHFNDFAAAVKKGNFFTFVNYVAAAKAEFQVYILPIAIGDSATPWSLAVATPTKTVMAPVTAMLVIAAVVGAAALALVSGAAVVLSQTISRPIVKVAGVLKTVASGDLTRSVGVNTKDEIGDLARDLNSTVEGIKGMINAIKKQSGKLSEIGNDLASNMAETAAAVNEVTANIRSIKSRVINQSASVTETHASMEQAVVNIRKLDSYIEKQGGNISKTSSAIEEMVANIHSVAETLVKNTDNVHILREASEIGRSGLQDVASDIK